MNFARPNWEIIQRGDGTGEVTTLEDLYAIVKPREILYRMDRIVSNINTRGRRTAQQAAADGPWDEVRTKELQSILAHIKFLCGPLPESAKQPAVPAGDGYSNPKPAQHILRKRDGNWGILVDRQHTGWNFAGFSSRPEPEPEPDPSGWHEPPPAPQKRYFYWALTDLLGLFFNKLGPAPAAAHQTNFYLPLTALYARWVCCLVDSAQYQVPTMYQCTWVAPALGTGQLPEFSLGASFGGVSYNSAPKLKEDLRKARWELTNKSKTIQKLEYEVEVKDKQDKKITLKLTWGEDKIPPAGLWAFGNCAETYPLILHFLMKEDGELSKNICGFAMKGEAVIVGENMEWVKYDQDYLLSTSDNGKRSYHEFIAAPCKNCAVIINHFGADANHFAPGKIFP